MQRDDRIFHFISGLPRSGSTLLANILAQNPRFHTTQTSGIADIMFLVRNSWDNLIEWRAHPDEEGKVRVLRSILEGYYSNVEKPVIFDKSRAWVSLYGMAEEVLDHQPKVLVPVRDIRDILASFEKLWRRTSSTTQMPQEKKEYVRFQSIEGRCAVWMSPDQPVGIAYNRVKDAVVRGHYENMYFVEFEKLTSEPEVEMKRVYKFLGEDWYEHNFDNIEQVTWEDDSVHGIKGLHDIRKKIESVGPQWPEVLGHAAEPYKGLEFWRKL